jgi:multicomponent Na+:H+ antiporter subunit E
MKPTRAFSGALWAFAIWLLLTWTVPAEQLVFGAVLAVLVGVALSPLGDTVAPWRLFDPRRARAIGVLIAESLARIVRANVVLAARIWAPSRPLRSGMVIVPTATRTDGEIAALGLITSLIVDNQIVDVDSGKHLMQYHAVSVPPGTRKDVAEVVTVPTERRVLQISRRRRR